MSTFHVLFDGKRSPGMFSMAYYAYWKGYDNNGMTVSNLMESDEYGAGNGYIADPENRLMIDIDYEIEE